MYMLYKVCVQDLRKGTNYLWAVQDAAPARVFSCFLTYIVRKHLFSLASAAMLLHVSGGQQKEFLSGKNLCVLSMLCVSMHAHHHCAWLALAISTVMVHLLARPRGKIRQKVLSKYYLSIKASARQ